ncbi:Mu transposase domain-containing protein [Nocardioides aromaticivorans]|uniref:Mu transposase domain-containing protein n=1 Tax=Nocardioides aromaticivorans TaxID=200618 RepID=UPI00358DA469
MEWRQVKIGRNYHLTTDYQHYSVPYALAGRLVRVRLPASRVTVFDGQQVVAEHRRKTGRKGQYSTDPGHVPPRHRNADGLWSRDWFLDRGRRVRARDHPGGRADPRPARDRGAGLPWTARRACCINPRRVFGAFWSCLGRISWQVGVLEVDVGYNFLTVERDQVFLMPPSLT